MRWMEREVEFGVVSVGTILKAAALAKDGGAEAAALYTLAESARYKDDGSRVFANLEAVYAAPATATFRLMKLAAEASKLNTPEPVEDAADPI